jgi:hypothetical protein
MKTSDIADADGKPSDVETNKVGLARRFGVGVRTIENWLHWSIITGRMAGGEIVFDVADCDMRLLGHWWKRRSKSAAGGGPIVRHLEAVNWFGGRWSRSIQRV